MPCINGKNDDAELRSEVRLARMRVLLVSILGLGIALRLVQYSANASLWLDEVAIARNILDKSAWELLTTPLSYDQSAPKGFLLGEKIAITLFGGSDWVLRLVPMFSSIIGLLVFWRLSSRYLTLLGSYVAVTMLASATPLIVASSQVKQYSSDIAVALILLFMATESSVRELSRKQAFAYGACGALLVWFSQPAVFVSLGLGVSIFLSTRNSLGSPRTRMIGLWWASAFLSAVAALATMTEETRAYLHQFWAAGFPPAIAHYFQTWWPCDQVRTLFGQRVGRSEFSLSYAFPEAFICLAAVGFWSLWRRNRALAGLLLGPIVVTLAAAIANQYPFSDRLIIFLVPSLFLGIGASGEQISAWLKNSIATAVLVAIIIIGFAVYPLVQTPPPYRVEDLKPVLSYLKQNWRSGDVAYVYYGAAPEMTLYAEAYGIHASDYAVGGCHRGEARLYFEELEQFRGRPRVWVIITHSFPFLRERIDISNYLDTIGIRRDEFTVPSRLAGHRNSPPAEVLLYDLSDPNRLRRATAESALITSPARASVIGCRGGPDTIARSRPLAVR
jgi:hypothetical protein